MGKRYWNSFLDMMGILAITYLICSLIWQDSIDILDMQKGALLGILVHMVAFFTFDLKLFSKRIWIRRTIVITTSIIIFVITNFLFSDITKRFLIALGIGAGAIVVVSILAFYITDKIEERRLEVINKVLEQNQKGSPSGRAPDEVG